MTTNVEERDLLITSRLIDPTREPEPIAWAVPDFAAHGYLTVLAGVAGVGKSQLALWLAAQAAHAGTPALYLDAENGPDHLIRLAHAMALPPGLVGLVDMAGVSLSDAATLRRVVSEVMARSFARYFRHERFDGPLVVLDSLRRFAPGLSENSSDDMAPYVASLQAFARSTRAAVVLIHHASGKPEAPSMRGSSAILDQCDMAFGLSERSDRLRLAVIEGKFRIGPQPPEAWLERRLDPLGFASSTEPARTVTGDLADALDALSGQVPDDGWKLERIAAALGLDLRQQADKKRLQRSLRDLLDAGRWVKVAHGHYAPTATVSDDS